MTTKPELAVESLKEDALHRDQFARRLMRTLISDQTRKATGSVVGLAGSWGAGKSSLLNFVEEQILAEYPHAVVVRFNPWLVSGRNDMVREFLGELLTMLAQARGKVPHSEALFQVMLDYGKRLSPVLDFVPGGNIAQGVLKAASNVLERDETLAGLRKRLQQVLANFPQPIVALVDEVDRVEDAEIHALAQLVRSIADFPNVSYLLAYDATRVAEALGNGSAERGRSYLEKIVQLQIPVPILAEDEMVAVLRADLEQITDFTLPQGFAHLARYQQMEQLLVIKVLTTLRDVKRLIGTFRAVIALVNGEADWIDVLGYCAVLTKAPMTAEKLKGWIDNVTDLTGPEDLDRPLRGWARPDQVFAELLPPSEDTPGLRALLGALFPRLRGWRRNQGDYPEPLSSRYTLNAVLRLGAVTEQTWSRADLVALSRKPPEEIARELRLLEKRGRVIRFLDRLRDLYADLQGFEQAHFWQGASLALAPEPPSFDKHYPGKVKLIDAYADVLMRWTVRHDMRPIAASAFETLVACGDITLAAQLLRQHAAVHRLNDKDARGPEHWWFLSAHSTRAAVASCAASWRALHLEGQLLPRLWEPSALWIIDAAGCWDEDCSKLLTETVRTNVAAFDALLILVQGSECGCSSKVFADSQTLQILIAERLLLTRTDKRLTDAELQDAYKWALSNARGNIGYRVDPPPTAAWADTVPAAAAD